MPPLLKISDLAQLDTKDPLWLRMKAFSDQYTNYVVDQAEEGPERTPGIHASELSCSRKAYYSYIKQSRDEGKMRLDNRMRMKVGTVIHEMIQHDLSRMADFEQYNMRFEAEVKIEPTLQDVALQYSIYGHADGVVTFLERGTSDPVGRMLIEIKSAAPDTFQRLKGPSEDYLNQVHVYMACLDIPVCYFLYFNKGNQNITPSYEPYLLTFDNKRWERLREQIETIIDAAAEGKPPERSEGFGCSICPYTTACQPKNALFNVKQKIIK